MAKRRGRGGLQNTSKTETRSFQKGMVKDLNESLMGEGTYLNARNAVNNSRAGDLGIIGNEPSNEFCTAAPYTIIGTIHLYDDRWVIFSTDNTDSEIGFFEEDSCEYTTIVNAQCLNFSTANLVIGEAKENFDCTWQVYWADSRNPDRVLNVDNPPWIQDCNPDPENPDCIICVDTDQLDCERLRMARLTTPPCLKLEQGPNGGELLNGTYQVLIAYTENEQRVSDYSIPSNTVSLFDHRNVNGSLDIIIEDIDETYDEFELVVLGFVNQKQVAARVGVYSTFQKRISLDKIDDDAISVPLRFLILDRPAYERSEAIYKNGDYLLRVAPTLRFSFNYQPLANEINTEWVAVEYPPTYYRKAGVNVGYMRDEQYSFFIRWVYATNDKSESYHIPGRAPNGTDFNTNATPQFAEPEIVNGITPYEWRVRNTATILPASGTTPDGGTIVARGQMGYWESSEIYPDKKPEVWGDLCGKNIRHHKMPDNEIINHFNENNGNIVVLGVQFNNIQPPVDNDGQPIPGIVGYEILRGSREGNKTVLAKGLLNNMGKFTREDTNTPAFYQNYPYNDLRDDPFLQEADSPTDPWTNGDNEAVRPLGDYQDKIFSFHSPDTNFKHPFLSSRELKIYETLWGIVEGKYDEPYLHPKHKILTDFAFVLSAIVGFGIAYIALRGETKSTLTVPRVTGPGQLGSSNTVPSETAGKLALVAMNGAILTAETAADAGALDHLSQIFLGSRNPATQATIATAITTAEVTPSVNSATYVDEYYRQDRSGLPFLLRAAQAIPTFVTYWGQGTDKTIELLRLASKWRQYTLQYQSHCFHGNKELSRAGIRTVINDSSYVDDGIMEFGQASGNQTITINNLFRNAFVALNLNTRVPDPAANVQDTSRIKFVDKASAVFPGAFRKPNAGSVEQFIGQEFTEYYNGSPVRASAHYVGLKTRLVNQYGQVDGIIQIPTSSCMQKPVADPLYPGSYISEVIFGGDTYIGRYTEKNTMFFFTNWMYDLPDGFEYDYRLYKMIPYPTYWMDTTNFDLQTFMQGIFPSITTGNASLVPSNFHNFDREGGTSSLVPRFGVRGGYSYLFNSGIRDFFVESEINIEYRDWEDRIEDRHYDPYLFKDYQQMFRTDRIKSQNLFKYDYSLSVSRLTQNFTSWASMQFRNYDPEVAETCYTQYPKRLAYSQPAQREQRYDSWLVYLINNYRDFTSRITAVKPIAKNGAFMLFENESPIQFIGVDQLQTDAGTKITLGDGGLFNQALQNIVNTDAPYEYGSCQDRLSIINTPAGLFWISRDQGRIFQYTGQLNDITQEGMKWWFQEFLPYKILEDFPQFDLLENPVAGVGCQAIYNNSNGIVYFSKRDFKLREEFVGRVTYDGGNFFSIGPARFILGDERYFDDASWTISYDPKVKAWISFHDWHPNLMMPGRNDHLTIRNAGIWKHNDRSDSYCNFYNVNYPFEVELVTPTGQMVNTMKSVEYQMEVWNWDIDGVDRHHVLDFNFDQAIVYNTEQVSGELNLTITPKNNAPLINTYPIVNPNGIDILYSKEEQKYRFNQFWDITEDRGEFTANRRNIWVTAPNGYVRTLNPVNLNYQKPLFQRKKFRHYQSNVKLIRRISGPNNMQLKLVNTKNQYSLR